MALKLLPPKGKATLQLAISAYTWAMNTSSRTWVLLLVGFIVGIAVGAGIGWAFINPQSDTTSTTASSATPTPTATGTASETMPCATGDLTVTHQADAGGGTAGSTYSSLIFKNSSQSTCTISGYPGTSLVNASGTQIGQPADKDTTNSIKTITLSPGGKVKSTLRVVNNNFDKGVCQEGATQIKVFPPDQTEAVTFSSDITTWCPGFSVTAVTTF